MNYHSSIRYQHEYNGKAKSDCYNSMSLTMNFLYNGSNTATKAINLYSKLRTFLLLAIKQQYKKLLLARSFM